MKNILVAADLFLLRMPSQYINLIEYLDNMISHFNFLMYIEECQVTSLFFFLVLFLPMTCK